MYTRDGTCKNNNSKNEILFFESPEEYADFHNGIPKKDHITSPMAGWGGGEHWQNVDMLRAGDMTHLAKAQSIIDKLQISDMLTNNIQILDSAIAGFVPNVAAYLAGQPECMFDLQEIEQPNINAPISIYFDVGVSAAVSNTQIVNRGIAAIAFAMAMNAIRPVDLYAVSLSATDNSRMNIGDVVKIASRPMDLPRALYMITNPGYTRMLGLTTLRHIGAKHGYSTYMGSWPFGTLPTNKNYDALCREALDMQPHDIFLKGGFITDTLMLNDPVKWVNEMVKANTGTGSN